MTPSRMRFIWALALLGVLAPMTLTVELAAAQQKMQASLREFLLQYRGKEVLVMDRTGGQEQFVAGDPARAYLVTLRDVQNDFIVVTRNVDSDKRSFIYPLSVIRRLVYMYDGKPYEQLVIEMY